ncbi:hypothetical protein D9757_005606 [Collybiopsis confluens]|uniref:Uncharacterized protein n=1 Tax=Collybiopsis confluens TaxID=2823264 RepID=A0A8H5MCI1_9AGAR|nr:hypothetical protein D9757_005606 [Collybiopsis confluens]
MSFTTNSVAITASNGTSGHFDRLVYKPSSRYSSGSESDSDSNTPYSSAGTSPESTSPISHYDRCQNILLQLPETLRPSTWVYLLAYPSHAVLECLFQTHCNSRAEELAASAPLGLIISGGERVDGPWTDAHIQVGGGKYRYQYQTVSSPDLRLPPLPSTSSPVQLPLASAGLRSIISFENGRILIVERPAVVFKTRKECDGYAPESLSTNSYSNNIPTMREWRNIWKAWDLITLEMIPKDMLLQKPIDLRHKCLFYIGHIPTFLDMLQSKAVGGEPTEPKYFWDIFERGIDPHVDDPDHCHNHSVVPADDSEWPSIDTVIRFRDSVRARLARLYDSLNKQDGEEGKLVLTRRIARMLVMCIEHEGWHVETLLYMLIQRAGSALFPYTLPPPGFHAPAWEVLKKQWNKIPLPVGKTVELGGVDLVLGQDDSEGDDTMYETADQMDNIFSHTYGWDNESPSRIVHVGKFKAEWRPVSNGEFERWWSSSKGTVPTPKSWVIDEETGEIKVRTLYGPVSFDVASTWPVLTSHDSLEAYAKSKGGRLPAEDELRLFLDTYNVVDEEDGGNTGFRNWHPVAPTAGSSLSSPRGTNGGVWEWTSTFFASHPGLVPTNLFTGYSEDFFDGAHMVVLGASYATIPRLASRRTVRNFWQHNYPYAWVGGRVVYDC